MSRYVSPDTLWECDPGRHSQQCLTGAHTRECRWERHAPGCTCELWYTGRSACGARSLPESVLRLPRRSYRRGDDDDD